MYCIEGDQTASLADHTDDERQQMIAINMTGVWHCLKHELRAMVDNGGGAIVNTSSIAGLSAAGGAAYVAAKHGVVGLTRVAATTPRTGSV